MNEEPESFEKHVTPLCLYGFYRLTLTVFVPSYKLDVQYLISSCFIFYKTSFFEPYKEFVG